MYHPELGTARYTPSGNKRSTMSELHTEHGNSGLVRGLGFIDSSSIVVCAIIGTGIFLKSSIMAQLLGSPFWVLMAWIAAGVLSLAGALTYAELGSVLPDAGGDYVYLRKAYGERIAFLFGWMIFTVGSSGIAALATAFATFFSELLSLKAVWYELSFLIFDNEILWRFGIRQVVALLAIVVFAVINCTGVGFSGRIQTFFSITKIVSVLTIIFGVFFFARNVSWENSAIMFDHGGWPGFRNFGAAMIAALWAYNGWYFLGSVGGEVREPQKNIPRALITGMLVVIAAYLLTNAAYFHALPFNEIVTSNSTLYRDAPPVAGKAAESFLGPVGLRLVMVIFLVSTLGTLHAELLTMPRIPYAMARNRRFFKLIGRLGKTSVPVWSIGLMAFWACLLSLTGTFDQLTTLMIFSQWIFYGVTASTVFVLRRKMPDAQRSYRTVGYPVLPILFIGVAAWLVINNLVTNPLQSVFGVGIILLGFPLYRYFSTHNG